MKKKYAGDESENEFSVDEPEELQGSDDDWTREWEKTHMSCLFPSNSLPIKGAGRRQSRRLRNSTSTKKPRLAEPSTSEEEEEDEEDEESDGDKPRKKAKGSPKGVGGRGRPKKVGGQQVTSTSPPKPKGVKPVDNIVSCEATSTTGVPAVAVATPTEKEFTVSSYKIPAVATPTEKEFTSGAFVVLKTDFQNGGDPPIWKIDGKALLQKYVPFEQDGKTLYKNTSTYSGWSANNKEMYYPAPIVFKMQNRKETIVEFLRDSIKEMSKPDEKEMIEDKEPVDENCVITGLP